MNKVERELRGVIEGTEKMSGFDSYDEGDMSYFDDDDQSYFDDDEMSMASGAPNANSPVSDPYVIQYENTTTDPLTAVIFGYNDVFGAANFGNPAGIVITNLQGGTYGRLIAQSNNKFFRIGKWRFQSATSAQLQQTVTLTHFDANGKQYSSPLNLSIMKDAYQFQSDVLDITKVVTIDGNSQVSFPLLASTTMVVTMFPTSVLSGKAKLNGGHLDNRARAPRLSGKNVAPVIIQTTQDVKGITKG
jgi:hypothetical protein